MSPGKKVLVDRKVDELISLCDRREALNRKLQALKLVYDQESSTLATSIKNLEDLINSRRRDLAELNARTNKKKTRKKVKQTPGA